MDWGTGLITSRALFRRQRGPYAQVGWEIRRHLLHHDDGGESYEEGKAKVLKAAKRADRANEVAFMAGLMGAREPYDARRYSERNEAATESGAGYYLTAFPRGELVD